MEHKRAKELIHVIWNAYAYEPMYQDKCAKELVRIAAECPEAYYHLAVYYSGLDINSSTAVECCKLGAAKGDQSCAALLDIWNYYDTDATDEELYQKILSHYDDDIFDVYKEVAKYAIETKNSEEYVRNMCLAYAAGSPYIPYRRIRDMLYPELYMKYPELTEKYAPECLMNALHVCKCFNDGNYPDSTVNNETIYDTFIISFDPKILFFLMNNRKYIPAFDIALDFLGQYAIIRNPEANKNAVELGLPYIVPYNTKSLDVLKKMAEDGNLDAINEIGSRYEHSLLDIYNEEDALKYAMMMAYSGLTRFHWTISDVLWLLYDSGRKDIFENDYIKNTYGKYRD